MATTKKLTFEAQKKTDCVNKHVLDTRMKQHKNQQKNNQKITMFTKWVAVCPKWASPTPKCIAFND